MRLPEPLSELVEAAARAENRSMNAWVELAVREKLERDQAA